MNLDSAIQHCEEVAKEQESHGYCDRSLCVIMDVNNATCDECEAVKCRECASEHRQLAEWLKELKAYKEQIGDAISRQAVLDAMYELCSTGETLKENPWRDNPHIDAITDAIENLPSVTPQQKVGRWIKQNYGWNWQCSECGFVTPPSAKEIFTFCPKCGCKMEVENG